MFEARAIPIPGPARGAAPLAAGAAGSPRFRRRARAGPCRPAALSRHAARGRRGLRGAPRRPAGDRPGASRRLHPRTPASGCRMHDAPLLEAPTSSAATHAPRAVRPRHASCAQSTACRSPAAGATLGLVGESAAASRRRQAGAGADAARPPAACASTARTCRPPGALPGARCARRMQMVYQDPLGALDRRLSVGAQIIEPLAIHGLGERPSGARGAGDAGAVGLRRDHFDRYPHELSGGQRQRIVLARALATEPRAAGVRRADLGARRVDPGAGGEPAARSAGASCGSPISSSATTCAWCAR